MMTSLIIVGAAKRRARAAVASPRAVRRVHLELAERYLIRIREAETTGLPRPVVA